MGRKRTRADGSISKSQAVRDLLSQTPNIPVKEAVSTLAANGVTVQPSLVYALKTKMKKRKKYQQRQKAATALGTSDPVALIVRVKELATAAGGIGKLKALVEVLSD